MAIDLTQLEKDAEALGKKALADSKAGIIAFLNAVETDVTGAVPTLDTDVENVLLDFIPSAFRPFVQSFIAGEKGQLDAAAIAAIKFAFQVALARINAIL